MKPQVTLPQPTAMTAPVYFRLFAFTILFFLVWPAKGFPGFTSPPAQDREAPDTRRQNLQGSGPAKFQQAMNAGRLSMRKKDYDGAIPFFEEAARIYPRRADAKQLLLMARFEQQYQPGLRYSDRGEWRRAEASLQRALKIASSPAMQAQANLANLRLSLMEGARFLQSRSYEAAAHSYQRALAFSPNDRAALAGLTEARYRAAVQAGLSALSKGAYREAGDRFRESLEYKPGAADALEQIERINQMAGEAEQFQSSFQAANAAIDAGAWARADSEIKRLVAIMQEAGQMGVHSPVIFGSRPLLPAYASYAFGDFDGASRLSQNGYDKPDPARAAKFRQFVQWRRRRNYLRAGGPAVLGGYMFLLIGSIYVGLRKAVFASARASA